MTAILSFIFLLLVTIIFARYTAGVYVKWERKQERFERQYTILFNEIQTMVQSKVAFDKEVLWSKLKRLQTLKYRNDEQTKFITMEALKLCYPPVIEKLDVHEQIELENKSRFETKN